MTFEDQNRFYEYLMKESDENHAKGLSNQMEITIVQMMSAACDDVSVLEFMSENINTILNETHFHMSGSFALRIPWPSNFIPCYGSYE